MEQQRGQWSGRLGFILAAAGSAVGLGNLWKFPYIAWENDGGAFVLVYIIAVALVGIPIMIAETLLGRRGKKDPIGTFRALAEGKRGARLWPGVGVLGVITGVIILSYYSVIAGWTLRYIGMAVSGHLGELAGQAGGLDGFFLGFIGSGNQQVLWTFCFMAATTLVVVFGVQNGIERAARILMPVLFGILVVLVVYAATTKGFGRALAFIFRPNFGDLTRGGVLEAVGHSFFTLSLGMGVMLTYGSYMRKEDSIPRAAVTISILDTVIAIMACMIMYSIIFSYDMPVGKSSAILFTTLPAVFFQMPGGALVSGLFYLLVAFAALTSTISLLEVVSSYAIDELGWQRRKATLTVAAAIFCFGILSALSVGGSDAPGNATLSGINIIGRESTQGFFGTMDYLASNWCLPVGGFLIALFTGWALTRRETQEELEQGHGLMRLFPLWRFLIKFAAPAAVGAIIVSVILGAEYQ